MRNKVGVLVERFRSAGTTGDNGRHRVGVVSRDLKRSRETPEPQQKVVFAGTNGIARNSSHETLARDT